MNCYFKILTFLKNLIVRDMQRSATFSCWSAIELQCFHFSFFFISFLTFVSFPSSDHSINIVRCERKKKYSHVLRNRFLISISYSRYRWTSNDLDWFFPCFLLYLCEYIMKIIFKSFSGDSRWEVYNIHTSVADMSVGTLCRCFIFPVFCSHSDHFFFFCFSWFLFRDEQ